MAGNGWVNVGRLVGEIGEIGEGWVSCLQLYGLGRYELGLGNGRVRAG